MKTATEEAIQLDRMIATAERIKSRSFARYMGERDEPEKTRLYERVRSARRRIGQLLDLRDSAAIPTR
jgi:hypothetical protein